MRTGIRLAAVGDLLKLPWFLPRLLNSVFEPFYCLYDCCFGIENSKTPKTQVCDRWLVIRFFVANGVWFSYDIISPYPRQRTWLNNVEKIPKTVHRRSVTSTVRVHYFFFPIDSDEKRGTTFKSYRLQPVRRTRSTDKSKSYDYLGNPEIG